MSLPQAVMRRKSRLIQRWVHPLVMWPCYPTHIAYQKTDVYTEQQAEALFSQFADDDSPDVIGAEGFERLCNEIQVPLDGAMPLLLAWQFDSREMGKISKEEWMRGTSALQ